MIVLSVGMQKSGSAYIYNLINDILVYAGNKDARDVKEEYNLSEVMKWYNNNIGHINIKLIFKLIRISLKSGTFAVKTHSAPNSLHSLLLKTGLIKTIYIYRDPRDVLLSVQDHGIKILAEGENHTFAKMVGFNDAFVSVKNWVNIFKEYKKNKDVLCLRYEDLITEPILTLQQICDYLNISIPNQDLKNILKKYDKENPNADMTGLHFNKGITNRYVNELSEAQIDRFRAEMGIILEEMGYKK